MANVTYVFDTNWSVVGYAITSAHFGTNSLAHRNDYSANSYFVDVVDSVGANVIRYPGGTIAETDFDPANPNDESNLTGITTFLDFCAASDRSPVIVLPTDIYFDTLTRGLTANTASEIRQFVKDLVEHNLETNASSDPVDIAALEIGNEYYNTAYGWTPEEFGALSADIAGIVRDALDDFGNGPDPQIFVQAGQNSVDDQLIRNQFSNDDLSNIDGLITHHYTTNGSGNAMNVGGGVQGKLDWVNSHWSVATNGFDILVSEWNVGESKDGNGNDTSPISGLMRSAGLMRTFYEMVENGVDIATIWTADSATSRVALGRDTGGTPLLTPTGQLFRMLSDNVQDTQILSGGIVIRDENDNRVGYSMAFEGDGRTVMYFVSGSSQAFTIDADFTALIAAGTHVQATILGAVSGPGDDADVQGLLTLPTLASLDGNGDEILDIALNPYETIQIVFTDTSGSRGVTLIGDDQNAVADMLTGSDNADLISGMGGNDTLVGEDGDDTLIGGAGADDLIGGDGSDHANYSNAASAVKVDLQDTSLNMGDALGDTYDSIENIQGSDFDDDLRADSAANILLGMIGDDKLYGRGGNDTLYGCDGEDLLKGAADNDNLIGGNGDDTLIGGEGADNLIGGDGNDRAQYSDAGGAVKVDLQDTSLNTGDAFGDTFNSIENIKGSGFDDDLRADSTANILLGMVGDDNLDGRAGNDTLYGGDGDDILIGGEGDDKYFGGTGADVFQFDTSSALGADVITDFEQDIDMLEMSGVTFSDLSFVTVGTSVRIDWSDGSALLENTFLSEVTSDDFHFL